MSRPIAVLLEIENDGHDADRCFAGLEPHFTLGVPAAEVRDDTDPAATARRIVERLLRHRDEAATHGYEAVMVATHEWQTWRDTIGPEVQRPFMELVREHGMEPLQLDTDGCNARFRDLLSDRFGVTVA
ncbi:MAG TPA: hypothetical protein VGD67_17460 [Pseudonocardiaceae bacterium]